MARIATCIAVSGLCARVAFCQVPLPDQIFVDGFEHPYISALWLPDICDVPAAADSFLSDTVVTFDTGLDANCSGGIVAQTGGPDVCVVRADTITVSASMHVTGQRALALVADASLVVDGSIDASAHIAQSGPGGGVSSSGGASTSAAGGGGAGFATQGGAGGSTATGNGALGGAAVSPLDLPVFEGGAHAGSGSGFGNPQGGGGGGALLLIACRGSVTTTGTISAGGGGGQPQHDIIGGGGIQQSKSGAGGGAGGYIVIQGLTLDIGGGLFANGGGGGGGNTTDDGAGGAGFDGTASTSPASGGQGNGGGATGGNGGAKAIAPTNGGGTASGVNGAGGGGSAGVLQLCTPTGVAPVVQPSLVVSPDLAPSLEVPVRH